ncbi:MAG: divalent-cation tolerance protein CutA [Oscillatoriales cyanobacterium SM2_2_1]|nr:divalent-cation tolerance protein CutA [Oscillatoriales cyanobacterium SM2_2_1]
MPIVVMTTLPDGETARMIAQVLVTERRVACAQILPNLTSLYIWDGALCCDSEHLLLLKTVPTQFQAIAQRLKELHPYTEPEILALPIAAVSEGYHQWLLRAMQPQT